MTFLYYPKKFEKIVQNALTELDSNQLCTKINDYLTLSPPELMEDYDRVTRYCIFGKEDEASEIMRMSVFDDYESGSSFGIYSRIFPEVIVVENVGDVENEKESDEIPESLLTQLVNDKIASETFEIGGGATTFELKGDKFSFELAGIIRNRVPDYILKANEKNIPFKRNIEFIRGVIRDVASVALNYASKTRKLHFKVT